MSDKNPNPPSDDAEAVLAALKSLGSSNYAALAQATGLSKIAVSSAITDLSKRGLVTSESGGKYSAATGSATPQDAKEPTASTATDTEEPPPPPPAPAPESRKKPKPASKPKPVSNPAADPGEDAEAVLAALKNLGSGNYAELAQATGLSKIAVSSAITDLSKRGLVNSEPGGKYSAAGHTPQQSEASTPSPSLATDLERLAALRESGALTAAEYTKAKKKLLDTS